MVILVTIYALFLSWQHRIWLLPNDQKYYGGLDSDSEETNREQPAPRITRRQWAVSSKITGQNVVWSGRGDGAVPKPGDTASATFWRRCRITNTHPRQSTKLFARNRKQNRIGWKGRLLFAVLIWNTNCKTNLLNFLGRGLLSLLRMHIYAHLFILLQI